MKRETRAGETARASEFHRADDNSKPTAIVAEMQRAEAAFGIHAAMMLRQRDDRQLLRNPHWRAARAAVFQAFEAAFDAMPAEVTHRPDAIFEFVEAQQ